MYLDAPMQVGCIANGKVFRVKRARAVRDIKIINIEIFFIIFSRRVICVCGTRAELLFNYGPIVTFV